MVSLDSDQRFLKYVNGWAAVEAADGEALFFETPADRLKSEAIGVAASVYDIQIEEAEGMVNRLLKAGERVQLLPGQG